MGWLESVCSITLERQESAQRFRRYLAAASFSAQSVLPEVESHTDKKMNKYQAVFFDLDGTLIDTAPDMGGALNRLLEKHDRPTLSDEVIRPHVSNGANVLIKLGFGEPIDDEALESLRIEFLDIYRQHLADNSQLFPGMEKVLDLLEERNIPWGIVTNKPGWLTEPLLRQLNLRSRCAVVVSADTCEKRKPHPMPMFYACDVVGVAPDCCAYVGDDLRDMEAGNAAGMTSIAVEYGYLGSGESIDNWNADKVISNPLDLLSDLQESLNKR